MNTQQVNRNENRSNEENLEINNELESNEIKVSLKGKIKIILWNAGGLTNKYDRLMQFMRRNKAHCAVVVETWWKAEGAIPVECIQNAIVPTASLNKQSGMNGISLIVNPDFSTDKVMSSIKFLAVDNVYGCYLSFEFAGTQFAAIYRAPSLQLSMSELLEKVFSMSNFDSEKNLIFLGDFNARLIEWNDIVDNENGIALNAWMNVKGLSRIDTGDIATFSNQRGRSIVDHVFSNDHEAFASNIGKPMPLVDHCALAVEVVCRPFLVKKTDRTYTRIRFEQLRDEEVRTLYAEESEKKIHLLDAAIEQFDRGNRHEASDKVDKLFCKYFIDIGKKILGTKKAGKRAQEYVPLDSDKLRSLYLQQSITPNVETEREIVKELMKLRVDRFRKFMEDIDRKPARDVLKTIAQINSNRKSRLFALQVNPIALKRYAEYFRGMNTNNLPEIDIEEANLNPSETRAAETSNVIFTAEKLDIILKTVPWNKAAGASGVNYDLLKAASYGVLSRIANWFKKCYTYGIIPSSWTRSLVVPVPKKGDLNEIKNYRPISLTECFRKLFEHCINRWIIEKYPGNHFSQGGFRSHHCVNDMVVALHEVLSRNRNMHVAFLDIKAAYDSVDRRILWKRCKQKGFEDELIWILKRLFDHNSAQLVIGGNRSPAFPIKAGVLQGSVLSPTLYAIFIDDLARCLNRNHTIKIGNCRLNATMYADDIAVFSKTKEGLQLLLTVCAKHAKANRYQFSVAKCAVIGDDNAEYFLDGQSIPRVKQFTYLGVETGRRGILRDEYVNRRTKIATDAGHRIAALGMNVGGFSIRNSSMLYKIFIRSKIEAGAGILKITKRIANKLESAQRSTLGRMFFVSPNSSGTILRSLTNCPSILFRMKFLRSRYVYRTRSLPDTHILKRMSTVKRPYTSILGKDIFNAASTSIQNRKLLQEEEMKNNHLKTCEATGGFLKLDDNSKLPWFIVSNEIDVLQKKRLIQWILKKFPASTPPDCGKCIIGRCTQTHIAECNNILYDLAPDVPPRFRPESLLSKPDSPLARIAREVDDAICACLPHLRH